MTEDLMLAQRVIELETIERGLARYEQRTLSKVQCEGFDKHEEVQKLIRGSVPILAEGIREWHQQAAQAKGRKSTSFTAIDNLDPDVVAAIGITVIFQQLPDGGRIADITAQIGRRMEIELEGEAIKQTSPKEAARFLKAAEGKLSPSLLEARFKALVERHEAALHWSPSTKVLVGQTVLNVALTKLAELFVTSTSITRGKSHNVVELTDDACEVLVEMEGITTMQHLPLRPMVRVRSKEQRVLIREALDAGTMKEVLTALNAKLLALHQEEPDDLVGHRAPSDNYPQHAISIGKTTDAIRPYRLRL